MTGELRSAADVARINASGAATHLEVIARELARRHAYQELVLAFDTTGDPVQLRWIGDVLARIRTDSIDKVLKPIAESRLEDERAFAALLYFGEDGDVWALHRLMCAFRAWPVSSIERADVAALFTLHRYYPAGHVLASSLDAASINLVEASLVSLLALYPDGPAGFGSPVEARASWTEFLKKHETREQAEARRCQPR